MTDLDLPWRYDDTIHAIVDAQWDWMAHQGGDRHGLVVHVAWLNCGTVGAKAIVEAVNRHAKLERVAECARALAAKNDHAIGCTFQHGDEVRCDCELWEVQDALRALDGGA